MGDAGEHRGYRVRVHRGLTEAVAPVLRGGAA